MYKLLFFIFTLQLISISAYAQLTKREEDCAGKRNKCRNNHTYTVKQRRGFYPFNEAVTVRLISYEFYMPHYDPTVVVQIAVIGKDYPLSAVKPGEFVVDYALVKEFKDLSKTAVDSLTEILFNIGYMPIKCSLYIADDGRSCYEPRNAIIFVDKAGKVMQYMEFCFMCHRHRYSSAKIKSAAYCDGKYEMLKSFFAAQGVKYGTSKEIN